MSEFPDTIVATASAAGVGGRVVVRVSGPAAWSIVDALCRRRPLHRLRRGFVTVPAELALPGATLPVRLLAFRAGASYTTEPLVEIHAPGNPVIAQAIEAGAIAAGARPAEAGEFTRRAFLGGRIDLSQAEAVASLIAAQTDAQLRAAAGVARGALARLVGRWTDALADVLAEVEAGIDLADEPAAWAGPAPLDGRLATLAAAMTGSAERAGAMTAEGDAPLVALCGRANVGKSSLLNALTGLERAIISATANTTRDVLTAPLALPGGREVLLADLAGLSDATDAVTRRAHAAGAATLAAADVVVEVVDAGEGAASLPGPGAIHPPPGAKRLRVVNKIDRVEPARAARLAAALAEGFDGPVVAVSARTGANLPALTDALDGLLGDTHLPPAGGAGAMHERHREAIGRAAAAAGRARATLAEPELAAAELREAIAALGAVTGDEVGEAVLGRIFARFCVGK